MTTEEDLLTIKQVARIFQISPYTVRKWLQDDAIKFNGVKIGGQWRIRYGEVKRFATAKRNDDKQEIYNG